MDFLNKIVFRNCVQYHKAKFWMQNFLNRSTSWIKTSRSRLSTCLNFPCFFSESKFYLQIPHSKHLSFQYKQFLWWKHDCLSFIGWLSKISFLTKNLGVFQMTKVEKMAKNCYMKLGIQPISIIFPGGKN